MRDTLRLGRIGGVRIGINWSLILLAGMIAYLLATNRLPNDEPGYSTAAYWIAGVLTALGLCVGVLLHELGHAVVGRRSGLHVDGITLWFMGGITRIEGESGRPRTELWVAGVGPLVSAVIGALALGLAVVADRLQWHLASSSLRWLALINVALAIFNLLPASPLDGGRVLHAALWKLTRQRWLATRVASGLGVLLGAASVAGAVLALDHADELDGFSLLFLAWFLVVSARGERAMGRAQHILGEARIADIMRSAVAAPGWLTVGAFWEAWVLPYPEAAFLLEKWGGGGWAGAVTARELSSVTPEERWTVRVQDLALPLEDLSGAPEAGGNGEPLVALAPTDRAVIALGRVGSALPVVQGRYTVGLVTGPDVAAILAKGRPLVPGDQPPAAGMGSVTTGPAWPGGSPPPSGAWTG